MSTSATALDPTVTSPQVREFESALGRRIIGQDRAIRQLARVYQVYLAGITAPGRPIVNLLLLGPTGSGKTRLVEATAEVLFGTPKAMIKIDCAEFQHSHEIAKLIGSPPGYLGHRETQPLFTQDALEEYCDEKVKLSLVLFDEIEKASDALWQLLLGILDKATLTLGDNRHVDFSRTMIFLTSNLGSQEMLKLMSGGLGFSSPMGSEDSDHLDTKLYRVATAAARRKFTPEFMNRIDKVLVFRALQRHHIDRILDIELTRVQERIMASSAGRQFVLNCSTAARDFLLLEGVDDKSGARHLKRTIERHLVFPLANLLASGQIGLGDLVTVDYDESAGRLTFSKEDQGALVGPAEPQRPADLPQPPAIGVGVSEEVSAAAFGTFQR